MGYPNGSAGGVARYLYEISLSVAVASAFVTKLINSNEIYWNGQFFGWVTGFNHSFHRSYLDHAGVNCAFCLFAAAPAILIFVLLRAFSQFTFTTKALRTIAGVIVVAGPLACLRLVGMYRSADPLWGWAWLRIEGIAAVACALLYACDRWPISARVTSGLLTLHSVLWYHAYSETLYVFALCWRTVPITAYFSTLMWGYFTRTQRPAPTGRSAASGTG